MTGPEERLSELGVVLPPPWSPGASLVMADVHGDELLLSAHMGIQMNRPELFHGREDHRPLLQGRVGADISLEVALEISRGAALNVIATARKELGHLDRIVRVRRLVVMVNCVDGFGRVHLVADAASDTFLEIFGEAGRHVRSSFGVSALPGNSCLAVEAVMVIRPATLVAK